MVAETVAAVDSDASEPSVGVVWQAAVLVPAVVVAAGGVSVGVGGEMGEMPTRGHASRTGGCGERSKSKDRSKKGNFEENGFLIKKPLKKTNRERERE